MKKFLGLIMMLTVSVICLINLGKVVAYDWPEIEEDLYKFSDYMDERYDEAVDFINEKVVLVLDKD